jgi:hypothetical protein
MQQTTARARPNVASGCNTNTKSVHKPFDSSLHCSICMMMVLQLSVDRHVLSCSVQRCSDLLVRCLGVHLAEDAEFGPRTACKQCTHTSLIDLPSSVAQHRTSATK